MKTIWNMGAALLISVAMLTHVLPVWAEEKSEELSYGNITYIEKADGTLEITGPTEPYKATSANIPAEIDGKTVTSIGNFAFQYVGRELTEIVIPDTITTIGEGAFWNCNEMVTFDLPDSLTTIGKEAFLGCSKLKTLVIPDSVTNIDEGAFFSTALEEIQLSKNLTEIAPKLLAACDSLKSVTVPEGVTSIGDDSFAYMDVLESVILPEGIISIGNGAFRECNALQTVVIPSTVTEIGEKAFYQADGLIEITIPDGITTIRENTFGECDNLKTVNLPDSVTTIEDWAFGWSTSLETVTVPANLKTIGEHAFYPDGSLTSFCLPDGVTEIGETAFFACASLTEFYIPTGVTALNPSVIGNCGNMTKLTIGDTLSEISTYAIYGCHALGEISVSPNNPYFTDVDGILYDKNVTTLVVYPIGRENKTYAVPDSVTKISTHAFNSFLTPHLTDLYLPSSLTTIDKNAISAGISDIWYDGTEEMWKKNVMVGEENEDLMKATLHFKEEPTVNPMIPVQEYASGDPLPAIALSEGDTPGTIVWREDANTTLHGGANRLHWEFTPEDGTTYLSSSGTYLIKTNFSEEEEMRRGDVDGNGKVDTLDAYYILLYYANISAGYDDYTFTGSAETDASLIPLVDIDANGQIDTMDAYYVLLYYAMISAGIPDVQWNNLV